MCLILIPFKFQHLTTWLILINQTCTPLWICSNLVNLIWALVYLIALITAFVFLMIWHICQCYSNFQGKSCQTDQRSCSRNKCLNNGTCVDLNSTAYQCECVDEMFFGRFCENQKDICSNFNFSENGYCLVNQFQPYCKCLSGFSGNNCERESTMFKTFKSVQQTSTIICIIFLASFSFLVFFIDLLNYSNIGIKHIDIAKWRREKLHGKEI